MLSPYPTSCRFVDSFHRHKPLTSTFLQRARPRGPFATGSRTSAQITGWCISPVLNQGTESRPLLDSVQVARRRRDTTSKFRSPRYYLPSDMA